jgi:predicted 3-demethylubiquinone-9 3-methyltransferase (glyoxalase superfamily)
MLAFEQMFQISTLESWRKLSMEQPGQKITTLLMFEGQAEEAMDYYFSEKFGWVSDNFGVSWQVNLERN